jgi:assimilatory nitrate reductase catalytic subunit
VSAPDARLVERKLRALDCLVVADFFLSETAQLADVVLPSAQWAEEDGTMTNMEGRVIRRRRAFDPPPGVRSDLDFLRSLAGYLGQAHHFAFRCSRDVFAELTRASQGGLADYGGITYDRIDAEGGVFWPCPSADHPGTPRLFTNSFPTADGRARFHAVTHRSPAEDRSDDYPLFLTTGRVLAQYQSGTQTRRVEALRDVAPEAVAEMHPQAACLAGVLDGGRVTLTTRRGAATFKVRVTRSIREDTVFVPFHWAGDQSANRLTHAALDPVSKMPEFKVCAVRAARAEERAE